jgi:hypothetical protein
MSLADLIYAKRKKQFATATPATHGAGNRLTVATVATVAVARSKNAEAANDPEAIPADCVGALHDPDGGLYLPWGPCLSPDDVQRMRADLVSLIETLADMEHWDAGRRDDVRTRAIRGPLADLMPNMHHFNERLSEARAEAEARDAVLRQSWRLEGFVDRRQ